MEKTRFRETKKQIKKVELMDEITKRYKIITLKHLKNMVQMYVEWIGEKWRISGS